MILREFTLPATDPTELRFLLRQGPSLWTYNAKSKRYHNTQDGRFIGLTQMAALRSEYIAHEKRAAADLASDLFSGKINLTEWQVGMREVIRRNFVTEYELAKGGRKRMTQRDWGILGQRIRGQYEYLQGFAKDLQRGRYTEAQAGVVARRAGLYVDAANVAFEQGKAEGYQLVLPAHPGDGTSECLSSCRCYWQIKETEIEWLCYWRLRKSEHCPTCLWRSKKWRPLRIGK